MPDSKRNIITTPDGTHIYYEESGTGKPILLIHGWQCSGRFFKQNVAVLSQYGRVITPDLRGHGRSSKGTAGLTLEQYAADIRCLIETLDLRDITMAGWSMGGPLLMVYWHKYQSDHRLTGVVLIDAPLSPMDPGEWNSHGLKGYNWDAFGLSISNVMYNYENSIHALTDNMFHSGKAPEEAKAWIIPELLLTPPWVSAGIMSDYIPLDTLQYVPSVTVPALVFSADSRFYPKGIGMGRYIASQFKTKATFVPVEKSGHIIFYEQRELFNKEFIKFLEATRK
jgi:pimeloyl-ACP methyl ester carboxylesterase